MKTALLFTHSFLLLLLFAFIAKLPLALSSNDEVEQVFDVDGDPLITGNQYYIMPALWGPLGGGGLKLAKTGGSTCPVTVLQDYLEFNRGLSLKFTVPGEDTPYPGSFVDTGTELDIEFLVRPICAKSSKWLVFGDFDHLPSPKAFVGIGGSENYPGKKTVSGKFRIQKSPIAGYKLVFSPVTNSTTSWDIGRSNDFKIEGDGWHLDLTDETAYPFIFQKADDAAVSNGIRSVV